jgi:hypothetical protein
VPEQHRGMAQAARWTVIVVRAWIDVGGIRVRLVGTDSEGGTMRSAAATPDEAALVVRSLLRELVADLPPPSTAAPTTEATTQD